MPTTTRKSKGASSRLSYKTLYLEQRAARIREGERALRAERKLERIRKAIAPYGEEVLQGFQLPAGHINARPIELSSHDYVCVEAFFDCNLRAGVNEADPIGYSTMTWRERPIIERI